MKEYRSSNTESAKTVIQTVDGGFLIIGKVNTKSPPYKSNIVIYKTDKNGETAVESSFLF
jgi:hypothetical protein